MLRFQLSHVDLDGDWTPVRGGWTCGRSAIRPYIHPALSSTYRRSRSMHVFVVSERRDSGDTVTLSIDIRTRTVGVDAGTAGVAPLFVATPAPGQLTGSWDMCDLGDVASDSALSAVEVTRLLTRRHRYSTATTFESVHSLCAGTSMRWSGRRVTIRYPTPHAHPRPRAVRGDVNPSTRFGEILRDAVADVTRRDPHVALELSGGLDSAAIASAASQTSRDIVAGGLIVGGELGREQRARRDELCRQFGLIDRIVSVHDHLPLDPRGPRSAERPHTPDGDVYREAFDQLRRALVDMGASTVLTGHGGDEVMGMTQRETSESVSTPSPVPDWLGPAARDALHRLDDNTSPVTPVALPTLVVFRARHATYLRSGLWPVAPYTHPTVAMFGRSLPPLWRQEKRLLRDLLDRRGLPRSVTHPRQPETFTEAMRSGLARFAPELLSRMLDGSPLVAADLVDRATVARLHRRAHRGETLPWLVYDLLATDVGIRSMRTTTARASGGPT